VFGAALDYRLLRPFAHSRNRATEAELDARFLHAAPDTAAARLKLAKLVSRFDGRLPREPQLRYLDMGCGTGELTLAFHQLTGAAVTGVDALPRNIERARLLAHAAGAGNALRFACADLASWTPREPFDVLLSFDCFEHIDAPREHLSRMRDFVGPGGIAALAFGPLFHSPFGDHMWDFFRLQLPWRGVLFSEAALLRLRRECFRPTDPARRYQEVAGGLNLMRYSEFLRYARAAGWQFDHLEANVFSGRGAALRRVAAPFLRLPGARDFFAHNVYAVLRREN